MASTSRFWLWAGGTLVVALTLLLSLASGSEPAPAASGKWQKEYRAFLNLPESTRRRILDIDQGLRQQDSEAQARLIRVMQRYAEWFDRLTPEQRDYIQSAGSTAEKIERIREVRLNQWIATLPKADQDAVAAAKTREERQELVAKLREREKQREIEWQLSLARPGDRSEAVRAEFVRLKSEIAQKITRQEDRRRIREIPNQPNPESVRHLVELAEKYGVEVPPLIQRLRNLGPPLPRVADSRLLDFLKDSRLPPQVRTDFEARFRDPEQLIQAREDLIQLFWHYHREELDRVRAEDELKGRGRRAVPPGGP